MHKYITKIAGICFVLSLVCYTQLIFAQTQTTITQTKGKEFWLGFLRNYDGGSGQRLDIFISSDRNTTGTVSIPAQGYTQTFSVTANVTTTVTLPNSIAESINNEVIDTRGILIETLDTVSVFAINFESYTADGTLVLPTSSLSTEYRVTAYKGINYTGINSEFMIVATQDGTQIDITPSTPTMGGRPAGTAFTINLNRGQSYQVTASAYNGDFTGTKVKGTNVNGTCRTFAVFSGSRCTNIPEGCYACDHICEQEFPVGIWGKNYMITPFSFATAYTYKVLADQNGTTFTVNGGAPITLSAGQAYEANNVAQSTYIQANKPVSVTQFMQGLDCSGAGDPAQLNLNPEDQKIKDITFSTVTSTVITQHVINVIMNTAHISQLKLDGTTVNSGLFNTFTPKPTFSYAQINLTQGSHTLTADSGFVAYSYGTGSYESYAYALGSFRTVEVIHTDTIVCTSDTATLTPPEFLSNPQWTTESNPNTVIGTGQSLVISPNVSETYIVTGSISPSGCTKQYQFKIEKPDPPTLTMTQSSDTVCRYDQVQLNVYTNPVSSAYLYSWTPTTGLNNSTISNPVATPLTSTWYYCTVYTPSGCTRITDSVYIAVKNGGVSRTDLLSNKTRYCRGDSAQLNLMVEKIVMEDDFDPAINSSVWGTISLGTASSSCGSITGNALYFNGTGSRSAATIPMNVINGGTVYFSLKIANGTAPCDDADAGENVVLEYSINNGSTYTIINTYLENAYPNFTVLSAAIPTAAKTSATIFRWRQLTNSGNNQDNWALDNVYVGAIGTSGLTFNWTPTNDLSQSNIYNPVADPVTSTNYTVIVTDNNTGCTYEDSVLIDVGQPFSIIVPADDTTCQISGVQLYAYPDISGTYTYQWAPASSVSNATSQSPVATPLTTTSYVVNVLSLQGCQARDTIKITVPQIAVFYATPEVDSICSGAQVQLNTIYQRACGTNGNTCSGTITTTTIGSSTTSTSANNATIYNGVTTSARIQLLVTKAELNAGGLSGGRTISKIGFSVASVAGSNIYQNFTIKMSCTSLTALTTSFVNGATQVFNPQNVVISNGINYYNLNNSFDWDGYSNILVEICYNNSVASANSAVYYSASGFNSFLMTSGTSMCSATSGTLSASRPNIYFGSCGAPSQGSLIYQWYPSSTLNDATISNPLANPVQSTMYFLEATDSLSGCVFRDSVDVKVGSDFTLNTTDTIRNCNALGVQLSTQPSVAGTYTYQWSPSGSLNNANVQNPISSSSTSVDYIVTATSALGCVKRDTAHLIILQGGLYSFYATPDIDTVCGSPGVQINTIVQKPCGVNNTTCSGAESTTNVGSATTTSSADNTTIYKGAYNGSKIQLLYKKTELNAAGINGAKTIKAIGFNVSAVAGSNIYQSFTIKAMCTSATTLGTTFSSGLQTVFNPKNVVVSNGVNYYNFDNLYDWDGSSNILFEICFNNSVTSANSSVYYNSPGFNAVVYTTGNSVCGASAGNVSNTRPNTYFKYCTGSSSSNLDYMWSPSIGLSSDTIANPVADPPSTTYYTVTATDGFGCVLTDSVLIRKGGGLNVALGNDTAICNGASFIINAGNDFADYLWSSGSTASFITVNTPGTYWVRVTDVCGNESTDTININSSNISPYAALGNDTSMCSGGTIVLDAYNANNTNYQWQDGSADTTFNVVSSGIYWVEASNSCGAVRDSISIQVINTSPVSLGNDTTICSGNSIDLDAGSGFTSYTWQGGEVSQILNVNSSGQYYVTASNSCITSADTINISIIPGIGVNLGNDTSLCSGTSLVLDVYDPANTSYQWQDGSSDSSYVVSNSGWYWVNVNNYCGTANDSVYVDMLSSQPVTLGNDTSLCAASFVIDAGPGYDTYTWQDGQSTQAISIDSSGQYFVNVSNICINSADTINVNFIAPLQINLGNDTGICSGTSIILNEYNFNVDAYLWQDGSTDSIYQINTAGTYWLQISNACGSITDSINVQFISSSPVTLGNDTTICGNTSLTLDAGTGYTGYLWQNNQTSQTITVNSSGQYYVSASNSCVTSSDTINISFVPAIQLNIGNDTLLCHGSGITLNAYDPNIISYQWQDGSGSSNFNVSVSGQYYIQATSLCGVQTDSVTITIIDDKVLDLGPDTALCSNSVINLNAGNQFDSYQWQDGSSSQQYQANATGLYWVLASDQCSTYVDSVNIIFKQAPFVDLGNDTTYCQGQAVTLHATTNGDSHYWQDGSTADTLSVSSTGIYYMIAANSCGYAADSIVVTQQNNPNVNLGADKQLCAGSSLYLNAYSNNINSYLWQDGSTAVSYQVNNAGTFWVQVTNNCGTDADTVNVSIALTPMVNLGPDTSLCNGVSITLNAPTLYDGIIWQDGSGNASYQVNSAGIYTATVYNQCGSATDSVVVDSNNPPVVNLGPDTAVCQGVDIKLNVLATSGNTITWPDGTHANYYWAQQPGDYWVSVSNSCGTDYDSITVNYYASPFVDLGNDTMLCGNFEKQISLNIPGATYLWQDNSTASGYSITQAGLYWVIVENVNKCRASDSIEITHNNYPDIFIGKDTTLCEIVVLDLKSGAPEGNDYIFNWSTGSHEPKVTVGEPGLYYLTAKNNCGETTDSIDIKLEECKCDADVPTAFSPNDDGANDVLYVRGDCIKDLVFIVYNRWGQKVFESHDMNVGWDGNVNGVKSNSAVFVFYLSAVTDYGKSIEKKGNVSLIR